MAHGTDARVRRPRAKHAALLSVMVAVLAVLVPLPFASPADAAAALVTVTEAPQNYQVTPRAADNTAIVPVAGTINGPGVTEVRLVVTGNGASQTFTSKSTSFRFTPSISAGLFEYTFQLTAVGPGVSQVVDTREHIVAGDVYVIQGQSNAEAAAYDGSSAAETSPYIRSFGDYTADQSLSVADRAWHVASGDSGPGYVGQWGIRMARRIVDEKKVPVAVINGAHGGQPIGFFQRNDANPNDVTTNYGRLRQRLQAAGVIGQVKAVIWYQGENDYDDADTHRTQFTNLLQDWKADLGASISGGTKYYVTQIRTQACSDRNPIRVREAQRQFGDTLGVTLLSTTALDGHNGCHYSYVGGYREFGDEVFANLNRDFYGGPSAGVSAPNPLKVTASGSQLVVTLRSADPLTVEAGIADDFVVVGSSVTVTSVTYQPGGTLVLALSGSATGLIHRSHIGNGPTITNATGAGLLAFQLPIEAADPVDVGNIVTLTAARILLFRCRGGREVPDRRRAQWQVPQRARNRCGGSTGAVVVCQGEQSAVAGHEGRVVVVSARRNS